MKRTLKVGLVGYGFMGQAHSNAWRQAPHFFDLPAKIELKTICGRNGVAVRNAAGKLAWQNFAIDWRDLITDPDIDIIDICTPNDSHCEIAIAAARAKKAILCEKPLAQNVADAKRMVAVVQKMRVPNMVCHNYRRVPAIVLARRMIERGEIGKQIFHFRARYAQDWIVDPKFPLVWRLRSEKAGSGAIGDIFSHIVDLARYLVGEFAEVCAATETFVRRRRLTNARSKFGRGTVDDAVTMIGRFRNGALASLEATRFAAGRKNSITLEINGSSGSLFFDLEEMNRLQFFNRNDPPDRQGFRDVLVTERSHPYMKNWWRPGHLIGYEQSFVHTIADFVTAISRGKSAEPMFADGLRNQLVLDAVAQSARSNRWFKMR